MNKPIDAPSREALSLLMSRQSRWPLGDPAPSQADLDQVLDAALRAPDHGQMHPWRFAVIRGEQRHALGDVFVKAAQARDPEGNAERFRAKALAAPMIIAMAAHLRSGHKVPDSEQLLTVGAAAMNMLNALHFLGYGGFWSTGVNSYDLRVRDALGFADNERLLGFLYIGTPKQAAGDARRPTRERFVREWSPAAATVTS